MLIMLLVSYFFSYTNVIQSQTITTDQKTRESLQITRAAINGSNLDIELTNIGPIELKVSAIYINSQNGNTFASDPAAIIQPAASQTVTIPYPLVSNFSIVAATERGTLSREYYLPSWATNIKTFDTENLTIGALTLKFTSFEYSIIDKNGNIGDWNPGWNPPMGEYLIWRVNVTNISHMDLTLNEKSCLSVLSGDTQSDIPWYINIKSYPNELEINRTRTIIFQYDAPDGPGRQKLTAGQTGIPNMVFLVFFGTSVEEGSTPKPYGQTIPFEAVVPI